MISTRMGSNSSQETGQNIHYRNPDPNIQSNTTTKVEVNFPQHDRSIIRPPVVHERHIHIHANNPSKPKNKPFNDLPKSSTSKTNSTDLNMQHINKSYNIKVKKEIHNKSHHREKDDVMSRKLYDKSHKVDGNHTANIQSNITKNVLIDKMDVLYSPKIRTIDKESEPMRISVAFKNALKILPKDNFMTMWFSWKNDFLTYIKSIDPAGNKEKWGYMLLNRLGPTGQEIYRTFSFDDGQAKEDIDVLLEKFDYYCTFGNRKKKYNEDIDMYVENLKVIASKYTSDVNKTVKEKILTEIDENKFITKAKTIIPVSSFPSSLEFLSLREVTYIWMKYENVNFAQREIIDNNEVRNCSKCNLTHAIDKCYADGKCCKNCKIMGHFERKCPLRLFKTNCLYCGESHFCKECPAYKNDCRKCHKYHFYWKCRS